MDNVIVVIIMGSASDMPHVEKITATLAEFGIPYEKRVSSAHKTPARLLEIISGYESDRRIKVYISVAGRSDALSGMLDAQVSSPVIACPPNSSAYSGADILSSMRMPSGVAPMVVLDPANAALAAVKILSLYDPRLREKVKAAQNAAAEKIDAADREIKK